MATLSIIDPVTRIEGHLRIDITVDVKGGVQQIVDAKSVGTLFRGFEKILVGRDPRDAAHITQRICGVCPVAHAQASVLAQDNALGTKIPANARILRNLVNAANFIDSHLLSFYLLTLPDYIAGAAPMPPFTPGWTNDRRFDAATEKQLAANTVAAIAMRRQAQESGALFAGKLPHPVTFINGGITAAALPAKITAFRAYLDKVIPFIQNTYLLDAQTLASVYKDYYTLGKGYGRLLAFGVFELDTTTTNKLFKAGYVASPTSPVAALNALNVQEFVTYSYYNNTDNAKKPSVGTTTPMYPKTSAYSWLKAPRYGTLPCEVGPLARMWVSGDYRKGVSAMDRIVARAYEALKIAKAARAWVDQVVPNGSVYTTPTSLFGTRSGVGLTEAPRGALGHWFGTSNNTISRYQIITPTCWNCSPRDNKNVAGPLEQALIGTPVADPSFPIEAVRIVHSFDPCLDCAVH